MVDGGHRVDRVIVGERRGRRGRERPQRPAPVRDPVGPCALALAGEQDERQLEGPARVGLIPGRYRHLVGIDPLHVDHLRPEVALLAAPAQHQHLGGAGRAGPIGELGVGDDPGHRAELGLALDRAVGAHQHRDRAEPVERRQHRQSARAGAHQHPDVLAVADSERQQATDDVVDPLLDRLMRVDAVLEQEELTVRRPPRLLVEQQADRHLGVRAKAPQPRQPRQLSGDLLGEDARTAHGPRRGPGDRPGKAAADPDGELEAEPEPASRPPEPRARARRRPPGARRREARARPPATSSTPRPPATWSGSRSTRRRVRSGRPAG